MLARLPVRGAYFSNAVVDAAAAVQTGNLTLRPFSIVTKLLYDRDGPEGHGVEVLDAGDQYDPGIQGPHRLRVRVHV